MAKKIKHGARRPPLSATDKTLYAIGILLSLGAILFSLLYFGHVFLDDLHTAEGNVLWLNNDTGVLCTLPFAAGFCFPLFLLLCIGKRKRIPILGNPNYKTKLFSPTVKVYPLSSSQYMDNFSKRERTILKFMTIYLPIMLLLSLAIYPMGIYPREVYLESDTLVTYNMSNEEVHREHVSKASSLRIDTNGEGRHDGLPDRVRLIISFPEESYDFILPRNREALERALYIKGLFPSDQITIDANSWLFISPDWSAEEKALLYELYEYTPTP